MTETIAARARATDRATLGGIAAVSAALLMTELALTRIFSVTMYYHFAFLAISIALFGLSASGVCVYLARQPAGARRHRAILLSVAALTHASATLVALACLVRIRVGLNYSPANLVLMLAIYALAALPVLHRRQRDVARVRADDRPHQRALRRRSDRRRRRLPRAHSAAELARRAGRRDDAPRRCRSAAAVAFAPATRRRRRLVDRRALRARRPAAAQLAGAAPFDVVDTKGHVGDRMLFSKWNSFSRVAVYDRPHGDWSLSPKFTGPRAPSLFMDIDSAASTPILKGTGASVGRRIPALRADRASAITSSNARAASRRWSSDRAADAICCRRWSSAPPRRRRGDQSDHRARRDARRFRDYSGGIYANPRVSIHVDDGRSFVRRSRERYDVIQASLVDTWAATAAGAYTLTENSLYTKEAFGEYLDHLTDDGVLTITRWVFDGLRLVSLAQEACAAARARRVDAPRDRALRSRRDVPAEEAAVHARPRSRGCSDVSDELGFSVLYAPGLPRRQPTRRAGRDAAHGHERRRLPPADSRERSRSVPRVVSARRHRPTTDDRPFFFHTTRLRDQLQVAFGRSMLFGNGLSALMTLMAISAMLVVLFVIGPLARRRRAPGRGWGAWLALLRRARRRLHAARGGAAAAVRAAARPPGVFADRHAVFAAARHGPRQPDQPAHRADARPRRHRRGHSSAIVARRVCRARSALRPADRRRRSLGAAGAHRVAVALIAPVGVLLGMPLPGGMRLVAADRADIIPWGWGINGAFSVVGATLAVFIAMNWGFSVTLVQRRRGLCAARR